MLKKFNSLLLIILILFAGCQPEDLVDPFLDDDPDDSGSKSSISYKVDGELIQGTFSEDNIIDIGSLTGEVIKSTNLTNITIGGAILKNSKMYGIVIYLTTDKTYDQLKNGDSFVGNISNLSQLTFAGFGIEDLIDDTVFSSSGDEDEIENQNLVVSITKIDHDEDIISGTFSFDAHDEELNLTKKITEGKFTNVFLEEK
ncbi:hypothetical protein [Algoriphagus chordae]|uniref:Lipoprotein n=1 Tax=Algoriphagus chordae TaxID=237019 RepID=A0A2W7T0I5_9BACT|nr:hypothetical protein [Algoriphagus chordae]PZX56652.1 hypothetical protein LV85_00583 [Algoriphagus chordae]